MTINSKTISSLLAAGVFSAAEVQRLQKKLDKIEDKARKALRQSDVNDSVNAAIAELTPGQLFKHRTVWNAVGREDFTRDEVLQSLRVSLENGVLTKVKLSDNNFQIFWCVGVQAPAAELESESADEEELPAAAK